MTDPLDRDGDGYTVEGGDCDDEDPTASPAGIDLSTDGVDQDCDGLDGVDADGDGYADAVGGGDDCDDGDEEVHPGAAETAWDGVDEDCDGADLKTYVQVSTSGQHTCAVTTEQEVVCWGWDGYGQASPPVGEFEQVCTGAGHSCGIRAEDRHVECWGADNYGQVTGAPVDLAVETLDCRVYVTCAIADSDGSLVCWGWAGEGTMSPPHGAFESVHCEWGCCALTLEGDGVCWETRNDEEEFLTGERWVDIDFSFDQTCGVRADGKVLCTEDYYGSPHRPIAEPPEVPLKRVTVGAYHACGISEEDDLECWGITDTGPHMNNEQGQVLDAPDGGGFLDVSSGTANSCAVDFDHIVTCWGEGTDVNTPP